MRQASKRVPDSAEKTVRDIRRATRRHHSAEEKIRIVLEGLRGEDSIAELCRKEGINQNLYYRWSKEFLEAGKKRLAGDTAREATSDEVKHLKAEARQLSAGAGSICPPCSMTSRATSWPGSCAPPCRQPTCLIRCKWRLQGSGLNQVKVLHRPRLLSDNG